MFPSVAKGSMMLEREWMRLQGYLAHNVKTVCRKIDKIFIITQSQLRVSRNFSWKTFFSLESSATFVDKLQKLHEWQAYVCLIKYFRMLFISLSSPLRQQADSHESSPSWFFAQQAADTFSDSPATFPARRAPQSHQSRGQISYIWDQVPAALNMWWRTDSCWNSCQNWPSKRCRARYAWDSLWTRPRTSRSISICHSCRCWMDLLLMVITTGPLALIEKLFFVFCSYKCYLFAPWNLWYSGWTGIRCSNRMRTKPRSSRLLLASHRRISQFWYRRNRCAGLQTKSWWKSLVREMMK